ncbi:MAG: 2-oxoacid:acceptor oxidoreductase family protein [Oscillospiraceae bacterium]|jgi:2-oxoglutarate ferredoxin oxidoreductase subunit gamma|nr:2-oxoacid:acceptor oxidoreductase family protein [Oscillospiraceae bacterium]MBQ2203605.1 2-oxoacid:acceptor oxidoreductase family protein [Oscillospiraceae bacterium]
MIEKNIFAGFGGQGVLLMGQLLAAAAMHEGKHTTWVPSYGPEMRGGTANCSVILSDKEIDSPMVTRPTALIVMNRPSLEKFEDTVVPGGSIFVNSSMIDVKVQRTDVKAYYVPCNELAAELGNNKVANMIMLGAYLGYSKCVDIETVLKALLEKLGERKAKLIPLNREALLKGAACVK